MKHFNLATLIVTAALLTAGIASIETASAKPVGPAASGAAIEACLLESDAQLRENDTKFACCSRAAGICVVCPKPPSAGNRCDVTPYRTNPIRGSGLMSPDTRGDLNIFMK